MCVIGGTFKDRPPPTDAVARGATSATRSAALSNANARVAVTITSAPGRVGTAPVEVTTFDLSSEDAALLQLAAGASPNEGPREIEQLRLEVDGVACTIKGALRRTKSGLRFKGARRPEPVSAGGPSVVIWLARKPPEAGLSVAKNVTKYGTGGLNIDACRVAMSEVDEHSRNKRAVRGAGRTRRPGVALMMSVNPMPVIASPAHPNGRWPTNVLPQHQPACAEACEDACPVAEIDWQSASRADVSRAVRCTAGSRAGASRFFTRVDPAPRVGAWAAGESGAVQPAKLTDSESSTPTAVRSPDPVEAALHGDPQCR